MSHMAAKAVSTAHPNTAAHKTDIPRLLGIKDALLEGVEKRGKTADFEHPIKGHGHITYSPQYSDDEFVYRHITIPESLAHKISEILAAKKPLKNGKADKYLTWEDCRDLGIGMSQDWEHYLTHQRSNALMFRRPRRD